MQEVHSIPFWDFYVYDDCVYGLCVTASPNRRAFLLPAPSFSFQIRLTHLHIVPLSRNLRGGADAHVHLYSIPFWDFYMMTASMDCICMGG
jgi:hypothetical protein